MIFSVTLTAETPVAFRDGRNSTDSSTLPYIPGGALLASLVNAHQSLRHNQEELDAFFMQQSAWFGNLYPASFNKQFRLLQSNSLPVYPIPNTARTCKRFSGFLYDELPPNEHHGVQDHLLAWSLFALSKQTNINLLEHTKSCGYSYEPGHSCPEKIDRFLGFYRRGREPDQWGTAQAKEILRTRTGINRATGTVEQGVLYSRSMLAEGTRFWGTFGLADGVETDFEAFVEEADEAGLLRVGHNRTRGLGKVKIVELRPLQRDNAAELATRIRAFDRQLRQVAETEGVTTPHALYLPITLTSDAIITDHLLREYMGLSAKYLADTWQIPGAELIYSNMETRRIMGWNDLWRLPKADNIAVTMGSVFLFGLSRPLDEALAETLLRMQSEGIGNRRREGFGQIFVSNPFHWEANKV